MNLIVYTDGGALNNPGPAASAYLIYQGKKLLFKNALSIGNASNNVAEYTALILALKKIGEIKKTAPVSSITCLADSKLLVMQMRGLYKIKHPDMKRLHTEAKILEMALGVVPVYKHIPREQNEEADALVKSVLLP
ncbi:ribonuclease HI family protein [Candidatus Roizmanbacteria bacterium]|nr:ribonuclease HI family protein [Candidatus Roizmanbacteria bacterium]